MKFSEVKKVVKKWILLVFVIATSLSALRGQGQQNIYIKGQLKEQKSMQPVAFATVALRRTADSTLITGTASDIDGEFSIGPIPDGSYCIIISAIGYIGASKNIGLINNYDAGTILLMEKSITLGEVAVVGDRVKAKAGADKTTFFINKKMYDASNNGVDILSFIPGIQVDLMKNISLEGSQQIIIMVDGKERDRNFLGQLNASQIDKVDVISTPGSRYDADVTGVINIILKKDKESGISGHFHAEVPTSASLIYVFPDYSINYSFKKLNLYTSYDGSLSYLDIVESSNRNIHNTRVTMEIKSDQFLRQEDWSHRFHYGFDYILNEKNQINFYAFYNPWSNELNGKVEMLAPEDNISDQRWSALKQDKDINRSTLYSLYYKHNFNKTGREIAFDLSYSNFKAENSTTYVNTDILSDNYLTSQVNTVKPLQNSVSYKIDYSSPITAKLKFDAGFKVRSQLLKDRQPAGFKYYESILAMYGTITYNFSKLTLNTGIRAEKSTSGLTGSYNNNVFALLPDATVNYKLTPNQTIKLSYSRTVYRPNIYELNPYTSMNDPFSIQSGNPDLKPEFRQNLSIDYSKIIGNSYISFQLFSKKKADAVNQYTFINDADIFETRVANLGDIHEYGIQITGALKLHKAIAVNPCFKLLNIYTTGNDLSKQFDIANRHKTAFESGLSAIVTFKYDIVASFQFQYNTSEIDIQGMSFSDALYFISLEKSFKQNFKIGIMSALPFSKSFTYQGSEIKGRDFYSHSEGNIKLSAFPVWLKFTYQFNSGKKVNKINRVKEDIDKMPKKGF
jgi:hypothetical protein